MLIRALQVIIRKSSAVLLFLRVFHVKLASSKINRLQLLVQCVPMQMLRDQPLRSGVQARLIVDVARATQV